MDNSIAERTRWKIVGGEREEKDGEDDCDGR